MEGNQKGSSETLFQKVLKEMMFYRKQTKFIQKTNDELWKSLLPFLQKYFSS